MNTNSKSNRNIIVLYTFVGIIAVISIICIIKMRSKKEDNLIANVYSDGKLIDSIDLNEVEEEYEIKVDAPNGGYNIITVRKGEIAVTRSNCPDKTCVHTGFVKSHYTPIVCLPNHLKIEIVVDGKAKEIDGVTY